MSQACTGNCVDKISSPMWGQDFILSMASWKLATTGRAAAARRRRSRPRASAIESGLTGNAGLTPGISVRTETRLSPSSQMN